MNALGFSDKGFSDDAPALMRKLLQAVRAEWDTLIRRHVAPSRQNDYRKGMRSSLAGGQLTLTLHGFDAVKADKGWAPAQIVSGTAEDGLNAGLGEYDGTPKDMRPSVLRGRSSRVIKFDLPKSSQELVQDFQKGMLKKLMANANTMRKAQQAQAQTNRATLVFSRRLGSLAVGSDAGAVDLPKHKPFHKVPLMHRITRTVNADGKRGWLFSIFRTMSNKRDERWFTAGTPPSNVLDRLEKSIPKLLKKVFEG